AMDHQIRKQRPVDAFPRSIGRIGQVIQIEDELHLVLTPRAVLEIKKTRNLMDVLAIDQIGKGTFTLAVQTKLVHILSGHVSQASYADVRSAHDCMRMRPYGLNRAHGPLRRTDKG